MRERIKKIFENADADVIVIMNGSSNIDMTFFYVTGFENGLFENSVAVLYPDGDMDVICTELEESAGGKVHVFSSNKEKMDLIKEHAKAERIGINGMTISYRNFISIRNLFPEADFIDVGDAIRTARMVKDRTEIEIIKKACKIAAGISWEVESFLHEGMKESEVRAEIEYIMGKRGAVPSFDTIVAFGRNSALPHYSTGEKRFEFPVLVDFGARYKRYCSDMTRTFVSGVEQKKIYELVGEGQEIAFDIMQEGIEARTIHDAVDKLFVKKGFEKLIHSLGHSIGLEVHDGFSMKESVILKEGMVLTVEPGIYLKNKWGVRIEDDIIVKKDGIEILTKK